MIKYRVIVAHPDHQNHGHHYEVQRKETGRFSSWEGILLADDLEDADRIIREDIQKRKKINAKNLPAHGTVVKEFDESDLLVEKLRGRKMFWPFRKKQVTEEVQERDAVSEQMVVAALKGEKYSPNSFRIEVRLQAGKTLYVAQKKWMSGMHWTDMEVCDTEEEARDRINRSKEYDFKQYLEEQEKKASVVIKHIDV